MRFKVGEELDGLEFLRTVSGSSHSVAYVVRDVITQRLEYLKLVPDNLQEDTDALERFLREARLHARLSHPNIAQFYSVRRIKGTLVMTREWIEGESLSSKLADGPLSIPQAVDYVSQGLAALGYAHGQGVIHRNVTSDNLLITESGVVKLTGFDLARGVADPRLTSTGVTLGSVHYMAPEQVKGLIFAGERSDLYAIGMVLYEAVVGDVAFRRESHFDVMMAQVSAPLEFPRDREQALPPALEAVIRRALEKDPAARFQSAAEFQGKLAAIVEDGYPEKEMPGPVATPLPLFGGPVRSPFGETLRPEPGQAVEPRPPQMHFPPLVQSPAPPAPTPTAPLVAAPTASPEVNPTAPAAATPLPPQTDAPAPPPDVAIPELPEWPDERSLFTESLGVTMAAFTVGLVLLYAGLRLLNG